MMAAAAAAVGNQATHMQTPIIVGHMCAESSGRGRGLVEVVHTVQAVCGTTSVTVVDRDRQGGVAPPIRNLLMQACLGLSTYSWALVTFALEFPVHV